MLYDKNKNQDRKYFRVNYDFCGNKSLLNSQQLIFI